MDELNENTINQVTVMEPEEKKNNKMFKDGFEAGAGVAAGYCAAVGVTYGIYKAGTFVCRKIGAAINKRAAKKAKEEAEKN